MGHGELMIDMEGGGEEEDGGRAKPEVREVPSLEDPQVTVTLILSLFLSVSLCLSV